VEKSQSVVKIALFIFLGLIFGGILGEVLGLFLGQMGVISGGEANFNNPIRSLFVTAFQPSIGLNQGEGLILDLYLIKIRFGIGLKLNLCSILGVVLSLYVMKWSRR